MTHIRQDRAGKLAPPISGKIYEGRVARTHPEDDPLRYDGDHNECRDAAGLQEICDQLQTPRPFTLYHPDGLIERGTKADVIGQVIGARVEGDHVIARIMVTDARGDAAIAEGMHELSLGYTSVLRDGKWQTQIKIDHLALVPMARCGSSCALRADCAGINSCSCKTRAMSYTTGTVAITPSSDGQLPASLRAESPSSATNQGTIIMDELSKKLGEALADAAAHKARADQLDTDLKTAKKAQLDAEVLATNAQATLTAQKVAHDAALAAEKLRADTAEATSKQTIDKAKLDSVADLAVAVRTRVALETQANRILGSIDSEGKPIDRSNLNDRAIKVAVIKHVDGMDVPADKVDPWVDGVYDGALTRATAAVVSIAAVRGQIEQVREDGAKKIAAPTGIEAERAARQDMANRRRNGRA